MKAIIATKYGPPEVLQHAEVETPEPKPDELLVRIFASAVTTGDARLRAMNVPSGFRTITRLLFGITKPRKPVPGMVFAGRIEVVGSEVTGFAVGDEVFGTSEESGCHAEFLAVPESGTVAKKPPSLSFEEAAAIPFGAMTSLVFLRDFGKIKKGDRILVVGASGALGVYGVQIGKYYDAHVTGVCSTPNVDLVRSLGADDVIDYTKDDYQRSEQPYDIIYDTIGKVTLASAKEILRNDGRLLLAVASVPQFFQVGLSSITRGPRLVTGAAMFKKSYLTDVVDLIDTGDLKPVIGRSFGIDQIADAHYYADSGHKRGSAVVVMASPALGSG